MKTAKGQPVTDIDHHVVYTDPKYSLSKTIALLHRYYSDLGHTTALSIAETWAPWCDTNGSKLYHLGWGRTCHDGVGAAPAFTGHRCRKPANGVPLRGQCGPCNCPNELAEFYVKESGKGVNDDPKKKDWRRVGAVWPHGKGGGFDVVIYDQLAVSGRITCTVPKDDEAPEETAPAE